MTRPGPLTLCLVAALAAGCGNDRVDRERRDHARAACATVVGMTVEQAGAAVGLGSGVVARSCIAAGSPIGEADACPGAPGPYTAAVCQVGFEWCASGTSLCSSGPLAGCAYACIVRVVAATPLDVTPASTVCASQFVSGQPLMPVSELVCQ
jgi:hypothetical protein